LKSPHTVELYDFGVTDTGSYYYVMELLEGNDLEQLVQREGPLEAGRVVHILQQVLDSLAEAHAQGLVHRDVKPANIHISQRSLEQEFVKVLDFGLVKSSIRQNTDMTLSLENRVVGTPAYLAPEAITGETPVDARADLYSLGCVAYYLLTGKLVFEAETAMAMAIAHVTAKPTPPSKRTHQIIPPKLERIVLACLEKSPERRPQSAVALLAMLKELDFDRTVTASGELTLLPSSGRELNSAAAN
jgi:serine/threonine-protein kinase